MASLLTSAAALPSYGGCARHGGASLALLALRDEVHFLAVGFGDALSYYAFVEAPQQLFDGLSIASFDFHCLPDGCERFVPSV